MGRLVASKASCPGRTTVAAVTIAPMSFRARLRLGAAGARLRIRPWVVNGQGRRIYLVPDDRRAQRLAITRGALDRDAIAVWRQLVEIGPADLILDIGANYGEVILSADYPDDPDIAVVEPNPRLVSPLRRSISAAGLHATVHPIAASDGTGPATLNLYGRSTGTSSLETRRPTADRTVEVQRAPIDDLVAPGHEQCLFKIDVEGHEAQVLAGMARTLAACQSWRGMIEHGRDRGLIDLSFAPHVYAVRRADMSFEPVDDDVRARLKSDDGPYSKDLVLSSHPI
jgi:FkbM family methyltransferase